MVARRALSSAALAMAGCVAWGLSSACPARATLVTFSGLTTNGQTAVPSTYQPLMQTYTGTASTGNSGASAAYTDGANLGVTITWDGGESSTNRHVNASVTDHTGDGAGDVLYDNGENPMTITFSQPVVIPSLYYANFHSGSFSMEFQGYSTPGSSTPAVDVTSNYSQPTSYTWLQETGLAGAPIEQLVITGASYKQIDDMTINLAPEPTSAGLVGLACLAALARRRRRTT